MTRFFGAVLVAGALLLGVLGWSPVGALVTRTAVNSVAGGSAHAATFTAVPAVSAKTCRKVNKLGKKIYDLPLKKMDKVLEQQTACAAKRVAKGILGG